MFDSLTYKNIKNISRKLRMLNISIGSIHLVAQVNEKQLQVIKLKREFFYSYIQNLFVLY